MVDRPYYKLFLITLLLRFLKFDELEWKENPYGKTCKLY
jgi:hypothetical protein